MKTWLELLAGLFRGSEPTLDDAAMAEVLDLYELERRMRPQRPHAGPPALTLQLPQWPVH